jgi:hypothetical protein
MIQLPHMPNLPFLIAAKPKHCIVNQTALFEG